MRINIDTANAAFSEGGPELARILRELADFFASIPGTGEDLETIAGPLFDHNGNTVGNYDESS